jgi:pyruvate dehydrogenase complex dehydrogenase (E1) component
MRAPTKLKERATDFWFKYVSLAGRVIGLDSFGESAPSEEVLRHFGFNVEHVIEEVKRLLTGPRAGLKEPLQKCREQAQMREAAERVARHIK